MIDSKLFDWKDGIGNVRLTVLNDNHLLCEDNQFPNEMAIRSSRTGVTCYFSMDVDDLVANEFYDGERMSYISEDGVRVFVNMG